MTYYYKNDNDYKKKIWVCFITHLSPRLALTHVCSSTLPICLPIYLSVIFSLPFYHLSFSSDSLLTTLFVHHLLLFTYLFCFATCILFICLFHSPFTYLFLSIFFGSELTHIFFLYLPISYFFLIYPSNSV